MDGGWKYFTLEMPCLKDEIQACNLNVVYSKCRSSARIALAYRSSHISATRLP
jgi:hypothetical protein